MRKRSASARWPARGEDASAFHPLPGDAAARALPQRALGMQLAEAGECLAHGAVGPRRRAPPPVMPPDGDERRDLVVDGAAGSVERNPPAGIVPGAVGQGAGENGLAAVDDRPINRLVRKWRRLSRETGSVGVAAAACPSEGRDIKSSGDPTVKGGE